MQVIATKDTALFERELADMIRDHFKELLDELHEEDIAVDEGLPPFTPLQFSPATSRRATTSSDSGDSPRMDL